METFLRHGVESNRNDGNKAVSEIKKMVKCLCSLIMRQSMGNKCLVYSRTEGRGGNCLGILVELCSGGRDGIQVSLYCVAVR